MLGFDPDAQQQPVLESRSMRGALNCTRQWGKSSITAGKAVQQACGEKDSLTLVVSPSARQSSEFVRKAAGFARRLGIRTAVALLLVDEAAGASDDLYHAIRLMRQ